MAGFSTKVDIITPNNQFLFPEPIHGVMGIMPADRVPCLCWLRVEHVKRLLQLHQPIKTMEWYMKFCRHSFGFLHDVRNTFALQLIRHCKFDCVTDAVTTRQCNPGFLNITSLI